MRSSRPPGPLPAPAASCLLQQNRGMFSPHTRPPAALCLSTELCCCGEAAAAVRDRDGAALCVAEAGGVPRAAAARPLGHRQPPPHRLAHPRTQTQLARWTQSSSQANCSKQTTQKIYILLSLRTETKQNMSTD